MALKPNLSSEYYIGKKFNKLTVTGIIKRKEAVHWKVACDCGRQKVALGFRVRSGVSKSCGCHRRKHVGAILGNLRVVSYQKRTVNGNIVLACQCKCGKKRMIFKSNLLMGYGWGCKDCQPRRSMHLRLWKPDKKRLVAKYLKQVRDINKTAIRFNISPAMVLRVSRV